MDTVLVVDDEPMVLRLMVRALGDAGFQVYEATGALRAIEIASGLPSPPRVLVTDLRMEPVDGADLAKLVSTQWPGVRVLFVSGFDADHLGVGGALLKKPFAPDKLVDAVRGLVVPQAASSSSA